MELTINVGKNVASKIKLISKLGGLNSSELDETLSKAVDKHLSLHLIRLTKDMLSSVGVHAEELTSASGFNSVQEDELYETTEELGEDIGTFDEINKTSEKNALAKKIEMPNSELNSSIESTEVSDDLLNEIGSYGAEDSDDKDFQADENSWQGSLMEESDLDPNFGDSISDDEDELMATSPSIRPEDVGISRTSSIDGKNQESINFMEALLNRSQGANL